MTGPDEPEFKEEFDMSEDNRTRVLVVDDHPLVRDSLRRVLENTGEFEIVGQASDGGEAVPLAEKLCPDAVIMDLIMPGKDGVAACREIVELLPETRVLMLTASTDDDAVIAAVAAGADGVHHQGRQPGRTFWRRCGTWRGAGYGYRFVSSGGRVRWRTTSRGQAAGKR